MGSRELPDIYFEQYVLGELDEQKKRKVEASPHFAGKVEEIEQSNREILAAYPAEEMSKRIKNAHEADRSTQTAKSRSTAGAFTTRNARPRVIALLSNRVLSFGLSAALLLVAAAGVLIITNVSPSGSDDIRTKGLDPAVTIYRDSGNAAEPLPEGATVREGDQLQLSYTAAGKPYGAIFSVDGRGTFTLHYPESPDANVSLEASGEVLLPYAYELDDAPAFEKFYFLTSDEPFDLDAVMDAVSDQLDRQQAGASYEMIFDSSIDVQSLVLTKAEQN